MTRIDRYEIKQGLGRGAMGDVYLAYDPKIGRNVAIKVLQESFARTPKYRQRFEREARAIAALRHPNIIELYDFGSSKNAPMYLVMELIKGDHVGKMCRENGPFPESVLLAVGIELAGALSHAHQAGIIHRDLKPENVYLERGRLILADFGIVKAIDPSNPFGAAAALPGTEIIGTPGFMAPEQLDQRPLDARTDIFALGALLYYLGSRHLPFDALSPMDLLKQFRETRPQPLRDRQADVSEELSQTVQDCLEFDADLRPPGADSLRRRLLRLFADQGGREVRDELAEFQADPEGFRLHDRARTNQHLVNQLKLAVRDKQAADANRLQRRLAELDPENTTPHRITGMGELLAHYPEDTAPEIVFARATKRRQWGRWASLVALALGALAALGWRYHGQLLLGLANKPPAAAPQATERLSELQVRATHKTHVFLNGQALGNTPGFASTSVEPGSAVLEFVQEKYGRLNHTLEVPHSGQSLNVFVDWRRKKVELTQGELEAALSP